MRYSRDLLTTEAMALSSVIGRKVSK